MMNRIWRRNDRDEFWVGFYELGVTQYENGIEIEAVVLVGFSTCPASFVRRCDDGRRKDSPEFGRHPRIPNVRNTGGGTDARI